MTIRASILRFVPPPLRFVAFILLSIRARG
jgi:hypothetical protein